MEKLGNAPKELKWVEEESKLPSEHFPETGFFPIERKSLYDRTKQNLLVPIGLLATTACLTLGLVNLKRGDRMKQQLFMRGRVAAQGFTILAMLATIYLTTEETGPQNRKD